MLLCICLFHLIRTVCITFSCLQRSVLVLFRIIYKKMYFVRKTKGLPDDNLSNKKEFKKNVLEHMMLLSLRQ